MRVNQLSFGQIILLREDIAEVIVNPDIEFDSQMVEEYHEFLLTHLKAPFALLVNKLNSYSYSLEAQLEIANLKEISAMAVVSYSISTNITTKLLINIPRSVHWNLKIFPDREEALLWLENEQAALMAAAV